MNVGDVISVRAHEIDDAGFGVGSIDDSAIAIAAKHWVPGESADVCIEHISQNRPRAWGRVMRHHGARSPDRATPLCPAFGACGGCAWQHLTYPAQLAHKAARVARAFAHANVSLDRADTPPIIAAPALSGYRNTGKYAVGAPSTDPPDRAIVLGAYKPRSHELVDLTGCRIVAPAIERVRARACAALTPLAVYDERSRTGVLRYVVLRSDEHGRILAAIITTSAADRALVTAAATDLADTDDVIGVVWLRNDRTDGAIIDGPAEHLLGRDCIIETIADVAIEVGIRDFLQVNRDQARVLYDLVARAVAAPTPGETVIDVYCGVGGISFAIAAAHPDLQIIGLERNGHAVRAARRAAEQAGLADRIRFVEGQASDLPDLLAAHHGFPDLLAARHGSPPHTIVVNPPRKGLDAPTRRAVLALAPRRILYVSCGPDSLARDVAALADYRVTRVQPIDLMPGTGQVETVCTLDRASPARP